MAAHKPVAAGERSLAARTAAETGAEVFQCHRHFASAGTGKRALTGGCPAM